MKLLSLASVFVFIVLGFAPVSHGSTNRAAHNVGVYVDVMGDPFVSSTGFNIGYNAASFVRLSAGYGTISGVGTSIGATAKFMVPDWNFTPYVGVGYSVLTLNLGTSTFGSFTLSGTAISVPVGFDFQAGNGFDIHFGYTLGVGISGGLPNLGLGWYF